MDIMLNTHPPTLALSSSLLSPSSRWKAGWHRTSGFHDQTWGLNGLCKISCEAVGWEEMVFVRLWACLHDKRSLMVGAVHTAPIAGLGVISQ